MSTRGWKQSRRSRTFPVTRRLGTNRLPFCTVKRRFFGKIDPLMETFLEHETICRETPPGHVFVESLAKIDRRKVAQVVRRTRDKKQRLCGPFFALSPKPIVRFRWKRARLQPHLPSFIQIRPSVRDLLAKTTFQIVTIIGEPIGESAAVTGRSLF